ncbi:MAG: hypothetical protein ABWZ08_09100 [Pseudoxanthomonas sp.]
MDTLQDLLVLGLRASLFITVLAIGLDASVPDAAYVFRRPRLLLRSYFPIAVVVPGFAALLLAAVPLPWIVKTSILLMAVAPMPPFLPSKEVRMGAQKAYVYGLLVAFAVLSIVIVPLSVAILSAAFSEHVSISPVPVARLVLVSVIVPLAIGMSIRAKRPAFAARAAPLAARVANIVLAVCAVPVLAAAAPTVARLVGDGTVLTILSIVVVGLLAGHWLGGPDPHQRAALAMSSAMRHPGMALMIASANFSDPLVRPTILMYVLVGLLAAIPYKRWVQRRVLAAESI